MENLKEHIPYGRLYDAAYKTVILEASEWQHLRECEECILSLANILQVRLDLLDLRNKYSA